MPCVLESWLIFIEMCSQQLNNCCLLRCMCWDIHSYDFIWWYVFFVWDVLGIRMAMTSEIQSQLSKRSVAVIGGNLAVDGHVGGGAANAVLSHQISEASSIEFMASAGLRSLLGVQTSRWVISFCKSISTMLFCQSSFKCFLFMSQAYILTLICNSRLNSVFERWFIESF